MSDDTESGKRVWDQFSSLGQAPRNMADFRHILHLDNLVWFRYFVPVTYPWSLTNVCYFCYQVSCSIHSLD